MRSASRTGARLTFSTALNPTLTINSGRNVTVESGGILATVSSTIGAVGGGWLSSRLLKSGVSLNAARKITLAVCAALVLPVMFAANISHLWGAVLVIGIATAGHQGFNANMLAMPSDVFPRSAVGSVIGFGGALGGIGGMAFAAYIGQVLDTIGSYTPIFIVAGSVYFIALLVLHLLCPRYTPVDMPSVAATAH